MPILRTAASLITTARAVPHRFLSAAARQPLHLWLRGTLFSPGPSPSTPSFWQRPLLLPSHHRCPASPLTLWSHYSAGRTSAGSGFWRVRSHTHLTAPSAPFCRRFAESEIEPTCAASRIVRFRNCNGRAGSRTKPFAPLCWKTALFLTALSCTTPGAVS